MMEPMDSTNVDWYDPAEDSPARLRSRAELEVASRWCAEDFAASPDTYHRGKIAAFDWLFGEVETAPATGRLYPPLSGPVTWETRFASEYSQGWMHDQPVRIEPERQKFLVGVEEVLLWARGRSKSGPWIPIDDRPDCDEPVFG